MHSFSGLSAWLSLCALRAARPASLACPETGLCVIEATAGNCLFFSSSCIRRWRGLGWAFPPQRVFEGGALNVLLPPLNSSFSLNAIFGTDQLLYLSERLLRVGVGLLLPDCCEALPAAGVVGAEAPVFVGAAGRCGPAAGVPWVGAFCVRGGVNTEVGCMGRCVPCCG